MSGQQQTDPAETLEHLLARARDHAPEDRPPYYPTLALSPERVTLTLDDLHALVRNAASTYLHSLSGLRHDKALEHADHIAVRSVDLCRLEHEVTP